MNYLLATVIAIAALVFGLIWFNESQATKIKAEAQAQAVIIRAESDARFRDTQATAMIMVAALPVVIVIVIGAGGGVAAVALVIMALKWQPRRVIEQRVILQIEPGQPRREVWQAIEMASRLELPEGTRRDDTKKIYVVK